MRESLWAAVSPSYLFSPTWDRAKNRRLVVPGIAILLGVGIAGALVAGLALGEIAQRAGYENQLAEELEEFSLVVQALLVVGLAPLLEEPLFRLVLTRRPHLGVLTLLAGLAALLSLTFAGLAILFGALAVAFLILWATQILPGARDVEAAGAAGTTGATGATSATKATRAGDRFLNWWERHPRTPVYASITAFGVYHLSNFEVEWSPLTLAVIPLAVAPQLWLGLTFTIGRVRYGWLAGVILHAAHNATIWSITLALPDPA